MADKLTETVERIVRDVAELPDRTSPEDWPEAMLVTAEELSGIILAALTPPAGDDEAPVAWRWRYLSESRWTVRGTPIYSSPPDGPFFVGIEAQPLYARPAALSRPNETYREGEPPICEGCGKPVLRGQFAHCYEDVGEVHVDCAHPNAASDDPTAIVLLGDPLRRVRVSRPNVDEMRLPCDVRLPPATLIGAGCSLSTLMLALDARREAGVVHFKDADTPVPEYWQTMNKALARQCLPSVEADALEAARESDH